MSDLSQPQPGPATSQARSLRELLIELVTLVRGECPSLLNEDSGGDARLSMAIDAALAASPVPADSDDPHTGDDDLLDEIAAAYTALDDSIDADDDQYGEDAREAVSTAMEALEKAQALRVAQLHQ